MGLDGWTQSNGWGQFDLKSAIALPIRYVKPVTT
jgi:hypothetical protein